MTCAVQLNNVGTVFRVTFQTCAGAALDISSATTKEIIFKSPGGTRTTKDGSYTNTGTDGQLEYSSEAGFLSETGEWFIQGHVIIGAQDFRTTVGTFTVDKNL